MDIPTTIGIILDGNRRWAKEHGLPTLEGHRKGMDAIEPVVLAARDRGIRHVIVYAFSTENWQRSEEEVGYLMGLFAEYIRTYCHRLSEEGVTVRFVGQREKFSAELQTLMADAEERSPKEPRLTFWVCLSYGSRAEITAAAEVLRQEGAPITEEALAAHLWTAGMPDPDLIIRTSGEMRLSNFLLWQAAYSELFFVETHWPDFTPKELDEVLSSYASRERRRGK